ncbi:MAG: FAD-binding oxidoreductase [Firmicutes bacterium]|nr:FAD-binding oxidoreductase [Bacillota bacterium]
MASFWADAEGPTLALTPLKDTHECEVAVVGGGFTGLSCAYHLAQAGVAVSLFEARQLASGASGQNGGQVLLGWPCDMTALAERWGDEVAVKLWRLSQSAVERVRRLVREEAISCQFRRTGHVDAAYSEADVEHLQREWRWLRDHGHETAQWWDADAIARRLGTSYYRGGLFDAEAYAFHPRQYAWGLARSALKRGAHLFGGTPIVRVRPSSPHYILETASGVRIHAQRLVWATNAYLPAAHWLRGRILPRYGAQIAVKLPRESALPLDLPTVADTTPEFHYFSRVLPDTIIFGGRMDTQARRRGEFSALVAQWRRMFPQVTDIQVTHQWTGRLGLSFDFMPHIVEYAPGWWVAGGYTGHGAALSTEFGALLATLASGGSISDDAAALLNLPWGHVSVKRHWALGPRATIRDMTHAVLLQRALGAW